MIKANDIFGLEEGDWTVCLNNGISEEIYSLMDSKESIKRKNRLLEHISWHQSAGKKNAFRNINTSYCLQFIRLDKEKLFDRWLFLGAFKKDDPDIEKRKSGDEVYRLVKFNQLQQYEERLIIKYAKKQGPKGAKINWNEYLTMEVVELLPDIYNAVRNPFPGYDNISLSFTDLKKIIETPFQEWKSALSIVNGIYVITDKSNGKQYVGSTYNCSGVWDRWKCYVDTRGHGGDKDLKSIIDADIDYAERNFRFSLVETFFNTDQKRNSKAIIARENFWKEVLNTRVLGYNNN